MSFGRFATPACVRASSVSDFHTLGQFRDPDRCRVDASGLLGSDPTTGRRDDLEVARRWIAGSIGLGFEDLSIANEGAIDEVADKIIQWLGWTD